jgi:RHS repeat-associated protein
MIFDYVYQYKDHLGNVRLSYKNTSTTGVNLQIVEENNYYPFGLKHKGYNNVITGRDHKYGFGGKEEQDELGLEWMDFHARNYDPALGRWMNIDPLAEKNHESSAYTYVNNNPILFLDPDGKDNIVYLVLLKSANRAEFNKVVEQTNKRLHELKLNTRVQIFDGSDTFDSRKIESTDSYALIGTTDEISALLNSKPNNFKEHSKGRSNIGLFDENGYEVAEKTTKEGTGALIKTNMIDKGVETFKADNREDFISWTILHSMGHNAGVIHGDSGNVLVEGGPKVQKSMNPNQRIQVEVSPGRGFNVYPIPGVQTFLDLFNPEFNLEYSKAIRKRHGETTAQDNYGN